MLIYIVRVDSSHWVVSTNFGLGDGWIQIRSRNSFANAMKCDNTMQQKRNNGTLLKTHSLENHRISLSNYKLPESSSDANASNHTWRQLQVVNSHTATLTHRAPVGANVSARSFTHIRRAMHDWTHMMRTYAFLINSTAPMSTNCSRAREHSSWMCGCVLRLNERVLAEWHTCCVDDG